MLTLNWLSFLTSCKIDATWNSIENNVKPALTSIQIFVQDASCSGHRAAMLSTVFCLQPIRKVFSMTNKSKDQNLKEAWLQPSVEKKNYLHEKAEMQLPSKNLNFTTKTERLGTYSPKKFTKSKCFSFLKSAPFATRGLLRRASQLCFWSKVAHVVRVYSSTLRKKRQTFPQSPNLCSAQDFLCYLYETQNEFD